MTGPSSSCVWNPRVFADDARGWQCPFVLCLHPQGCLRAPRDPRRDSRGEQSPWLPLETRPDSPVPTLQGPCGRSPKRRGSLRFLPPLEVRPSSVAPDPAVYLFHSFSTHLLGFYGLCAGQGNRLHVWEVLPCIFSDSGY